jgi:predicted nucleic acid-binding protein
MSQSDTWIAATARALEVLLVSHNRRDFDFLNGLRLISRGA